MNTASTPPELLAELQSLRAKVAELERQIEDRDRVERATRPNDASPRESDLRLRRLAEHIQDVLWLINWQSFTVVYVSPTYESLWGRPVAPIYENPVAWTEAIHEDDRDRVITAFREGAGRGVYDEQYRIVRPDGSIRWIRDRGFPIVGDDGETVQVAGIAADITQVKMSEEEARIHEEQLRTQHAALFSLSHSRALEQGDLEGASQIITRAAAQTLRVERVGLWMFSADRSEIECLDLYELSRHRHSTGLTLKASDYPRYFEALEGNRSLAAHDARADPRTSEFDQHYLTPLGITSLMDSSIRVEGRSIGIICHEHVGPARRWSLEDQAFAASMADFAAMTLQAHERRRTADALRESEEQYRRLVDSVHAIVWRCDLSTGRFTFVSEEAETLLGYPLERWMCEPRFWRDHLHPEDRDWVLSFYEKATRELRPHEFEYRMIAADGSVIWLRDIVNVIAEGGRATTSLGVMIDITEHKRAEEELDRQRTFMRQVLDINPHLIFAKDRDGRFTLVNQAVADVYGTTVDRLIGKTDSDFNPNESEVARFRRDDLRVMNTGREHQTEEAITDASGKTHWLQTIKRPIVGADGAVEQLLAVSTDITLLEVAKRELDHRVKNNLTNVLAIAEQSIACSSSLEQFAGAFRGRLEAMAIAHDMLARRDWDGAEFGLLLDRLVLPYRRDDPDRFEISGPAITVPVTIAPWLAMVLHELLTNAAKHGALSAPDGQVRISWQENGDAESMALTWQEHGGPPVRAPDRRGFGTEMIERLVEYQLHGRASLAFEDSGVRCMITFPIDVRLDTETASGHE